MKMTEGEIGVSGGIVGRFGRTVNSVTKSDGTFTNKALVCPQLMGGFPGQNGLKVHCRVAPSAS